MPLSEDEQRILHEIEQQFYETDPALARAVGSTSLYRHAFRPEARVQLSIDFPVCLRKQIYEVFGDGFAGRSSQGFAL